MTVLKTHLLHFYFITVKNTWPVLEFIAENICFQLLRIQLFSERHCVVGFWLEYDFIILINILMSFLQITKDVQDC